MLEKQRQQLILEVLEESTFASVPELCSQLGASEATIRRDLKKLSSKRNYEKESFSFSPGYLITYLL